MKHTPGPWHLAATRSSFLVRPKEGSFICKINFETNDDSGTNARLIAAAPEMLVLIQDALKFISNPPHDPNNNHRSGMISNLSKLIARIDGISKGDINKALIESAADYPAPMPDHPILKRNRGSI